MSQNLVDQYIYRINELKLQEDVKILKNIKSDFENSLFQSEKNIENEMMNYCNTFKNKNPKDAFESCKTFSTRIVENFKEFSKEISKECGKKYEEIEFELRRNGFGPSDLQRFNLVVDYELITGDNLKVVQDEGLRTKLRKFTLNDMK